MRVRRERVDLDQAAQVAASIDANYIGHHDHVGGRRSQHTVRYRVTRASAARVAVESDKQFLDVAENLSVEKPNVSDKLEWSRLRRRRAGRRLARGMFQNESSPSHL